MSDKTIQIAKEANKDFSYIKWLSFGNGLIRPGCASFRDNVANGEISTTNFPELNAALAKTFGRITMQEDIMQFCKNFCGYSMQKAITSDEVSRKKKGYAGFVSEIHDRFVSYSNEHFGMDTEELEKIFPPINRAFLMQATTPFRGTTQIVTR
jgi:DNA polymerase III alpha subunit